jgi:hypothetical protein
MFAPFRADTETPTLLVVCARITERDPSFLTVIDADLSVGFTLLVMTLTIFPDVLYTVNTTAVAPCAAACGANRMRPVMEFGPVAICNWVSAIDDDGSVSIVSAGAPDAGELFPAVSVRVAEIFHVPSVSVGSVQFVADPITYVHDTVLVPLVAEMVMVSPLVPPLALIVGVVSLVLLSVFDAPESDDANKSRPAGANGAVPSMVIGNAVDAVDVLPAVSVSVDVIFHVPSVSVGSVQFVADPMT